LLGILARAFLTNDLNAITSERSFIVYGMATQAAGAQLMQVPMQQHGFDLDAIATGVNEKTRLIFLANPNNPTGSLATADEVDRLLNRIPANVVVVLDEAYYEFAAHFASQRGVAYSRSLNYVREGRNVVVLRTFSKVHGLAGARVGYGIAPTGLMTLISSKRSMYCVSNLAQAGALAALKDEAHIRKAVENNTDQAERTFQAILALGYLVVPTWANFLYCDLGKDAAEFTQRLQRDGIAVRALAPWGAPQAIRITVGTPEQNDILLEALRKLEKF
jgi:histidinol-phosphate aminotransferase